MKKILLLGFFIFFSFSCSSNKVCGGPRGKRCVLSDKQCLTKNIS